MAINLNTAVAFGSSSPAKKDWGGIIRNFQEAIAALGLGSPNVVADGLLHRFDTPDDRKGDRTGWYVLFADNVPSGVFGSWREGESHSWSARTAWEMTQQEQEDMNRRIAHVKEMRDQERHREADTAAAAAKEQWERTKDADPKHPYLENKGVTPLGARQQGEVLIIPMIDASGNLRGLQRVYPNGDKRFSTGIEKKGCFHWIGGDESVVYLCEGFATGASLHMATGL